MLKTASGLRRDGASGLATANAFAPLGGENSFRIEPGRRTRALREDQILEGLLQFGALMPIRYWIDPDNGWLMTAADGTVTFRDISAHLDIEQRNNDLGRAELVDARNATTDLSAEDVRRLVQRAADMLRTGRLGPTAIVTTDDVVFGMSRMYAMRAEGVGAEARVFRDVESATRWLDEMSNNKEIDKKEPGV